MAIKKKRADCEQTKNRPALNDYFGNRMFYSAGVGAEVRIFVIRKLAHKIE